MPYRKVGALEACWYMLRWKLKEVFRMPRLPDHPCAHPGCPRLVLHGRKYCDAHAGKHPEETRSASSRGYGKRWQKASSITGARFPGQKQPGIAAPAIFLTWKIKKQSCRQSWK